MRQWIYRLLLCITLLSQAAGAVPPLPMIVNGSVYINGAPAPIGTEIKAMIGGEVKGETMLTLSGVYGMTVDYGSGLVEFYINDIKAQSTNWNADPGILDLRITQAEQAAAATTIRPEIGQTQPATTSAITTKTTTAIAVNTTSAASASIKTTTATARATDAVIPEVQPTVSQQVDSQKQEAVKSPGFEALIVIFAVAVASKATIRRGKR